MVHMMREITEGFYEFGQVTFRAVFYSSMVQYAVAFFGLAFNAARSTRFVGKWESVVTEYTKRIGRLLGKYSRSLLLHAVDYRLGKMALQFFEYLLERLENVADPATSTGTSAASSSSPPPTLVHYRRLSTRAMLQQDVRSSPARGPEIEALPSPGSIFEESGLSDVFRLQGHELSPNRNDSSLTIQRKLLTVKIRKWRAVLDALLHLRDVEKLPSLEEPSTSAGVAITSSPHPHPTDEGKEPSSGSSSIEILPATRKRSRSEATASEGVADDDDEKSEGSSPTLSQEEWPSFDNSTRDNSKTYETESIVIEEVTPNYAKPGEPLEPNGNYRTSMQPPAEENVISP